MVLEPEARAEKSRFRHDRRRQSDAGAMSDSNLLSGDRIIEQMTRKQKFVVFVLLLTTVLGIAILFASGLLRFGLSGPMVYLVYVLLGVLASVVCFGLLSSTGQFEGTRYGGTLRLGGSIVGLLVVAAGGAIYERYFYRGTEFDLAIVFVADGSEHPLKLSGTVLVYAGNIEYERTLRNESRTRIESIPSRYLGTSLNLLIDTPGFQLIRSHPSHFTVDRPIMVHVARSRTYAAPTAAELEIYVVEVSAMDFGLKPDHKLLNFRLEIMSRSALPVPLGESALLRILTESAAPFSESELEYAGGLAVVPPGLSYLHYEGFVPDDAYDYAMTNKMGVIELEYDATVEVTDQRYATEIFTFNPEFVEDYSAR